MKSRVRLALVNWRAAASAGLAATGLLATAAGATAAEYNIPFPDCSPSVKTECLVRVELDGKATDKITAVVQAQQDVGGDAIAVYLADTRPFLRVAPGTPEPPGGWPADKITSCATRFTPGGKCSDLTGIVPIGSRITVEANIGDREAVAAVVRGAGPGSLDAPNRTWTIASAPGGGNLLTLDLEAKRMAQLQGPNFDACRVFPVSNDCGGETGVAEWAGVYVSTHFLQLNSPDWSRQREIAGGLTIATTAQTQGPPLFDTAKRTLSIQTGGPHFLPDGTTLNEGMITTFLPESLMEAPEGFALPPDLTPEEAKSLLTVEKSEVTAGSESMAADVRVTSDGAFYTVPKFSFSAPRFSYVRTRSTGLLTASASANKRSVTVRVLVGGPASISAVGKLGKRQLCSGNARAAKESLVKVACRLSRSGRKTLGTKKGSRVSVSVSVRPAQGKPEKRTIVAQVR